MTDAIERVLAVFAPGYVWTPDATTERRDLDEARAEVQAIKKEIERLEEEANEAQAEAASLKEGLEAEENSHEETRAKMRADASDFQDEIWALNDEIERLRARLGDG